MYQGELEDSSDSHFTRLTLKIHHTDKQARLVF